MKEKSRDEKTEIMFFDEGRFGLQSNLGRCWAKRGRRLLAKVKTGYSNFYAYSCASPISGNSFTLFLPFVNTEMMNLYLEKLSEEYRGKKIILIMDQAGWHKSKDLKVCENIQIKYLPPYSPELNPIEKLWEYLKRHVCRNKYYEKIKELETVLMAEIRNLSLEKVSQLCRCSYLCNIK